MRDHATSSPQQSRVLAWVRFFDPAAIVLVCAVPALLWLVDGVRAPWSAVGTGVSGVAFVVIAVLLQLRVGFAYNRHGRLRSVFLLLVGLAVWFTAAACAVVGHELMVPFTMAAAALLAGALRQPADAAVSGPVRGAPGRS